MSRESNLAKVHPSTAQMVGCCGASTKEACTKPPCPCNLYAWTARERRELLAIARKRKGSA